ncbi:hypothetical protein TNCV_5014431 [Trichonephila clavipes]|nr:hypothetical protein TNCV_5014431 [Trichonephila clavipes]
MSSGGSLPPDDHHVWNPGGFSHMMPGNNYILNELFFILWVPHSDKSFQTVPQVFDMIKVRTVSRPKQLNDFRTVPVFELLYYVARSRILLKNK